MVSLKVLQAHELGIKLAAIKTSTLAAIESSTEVFWQCAGVESKCGQECIVKVFWQIVQIFSWSK